MTNITVKDWGTANIKVGSNEVVTVNGKKIESKVTDNNKPTCKIKVSDRVNVDFNDVHLVNVEVKATAFYDGCWNITVSHMSAEFRVIGKNLILSETVWPGYCVKKV